jgi:hypothetical protein
MPATLYASCQRVTSSHTRGIRYVPSCYRLACGNALACSDVQLSIHHILIAGVSVLLATVTLWRKCLSCSPGQTLQSINRHA